MHSYSSAVPEGRPEPRPEPRPEARPATRPATARRRAQPVTVVDLDWRSVAVVIGAYVALRAFVGLVRSTPRTGTTFAVALLVALALNPVVTRVEVALRCRRAPAVAVVLAAFVGAATIVALLLTPPTVREARRLGRDLPAVLHDLTNLPLVGGRLEAAKVPQRAQDAIEHLPRRLSGDTAPIARAGRTIADGLLASVMTLLFAIALLLDGPRLLRHVGRLIPAVRRPEASRVGALAYGVVGRYVTGSMLVAALAGVVMLTAGLALRVPLSPLAALWVALWDLVPQIGGAMGGIPFVLLGFTHSATVGVACAVIFVVYLQIENHLLQPLLVGHAVKLSPPATMTAALVGVSAAGVVGALLAVPIVGAAKVVYLELRASREEEVSRTEREPA